jgi:hypothetical protein
MAFWGSKPNTSKSFGALAVGTDNKALSEEIQGVGKKFGDVNEKYRTEMAKYKKIADFNKKLSASYIANIHAMVDVSKLLNEYASFFALLKEEINKADGSIGTLTAEEIQYIESLTKSKIENFSSSFIEQSNKVKDLYGKFNQTSQAQALEKAQAQMSEAIEAAGIAYEDISKTITKGGARRKSASKAKAPRKKAAPKHPKH